MRFAIALVLATSAAYADAPKPPPPPKAPSVTAELPTTNADGFDAKAALVVFNTANKQLVGCYGKTGSSAWGNAVLSIAPDGKVAKALINGTDTAAAACMVKALGKLVFAKPSGGAAIDVSFDLAFDNGKDPMPTMGGLKGDETNGGFGYGRAGFGPGGGGTGWGTIGTGKYGTIGHGSGTGNSGGACGGGGRGTRAYVPMVSIGQPEAKGNLDKAIIRRYIKRNINKIQYCYEKALLDDKKLAGTVTVKFTILATGVVDASLKAGSTAPMKPVADCVGAVVKDIEFPKPKGGTVDVAYPFDFRPAN